MTSPAGVKDWPGRFHTPSGVQSHSRRLIIKSCYDMMLTIKKEGRNAAPISGRGMISAEAASNMDHPQEKTL